MRQIIDEKVGVDSEFESQSLKWQIKNIIWKNRKYFIDKLGMHYQEKRGEQVFHIFYVANESLCFRLELEANSLIWKLKEISDGLAE